MTKMFLKNALSCLQAWKLLEIAGESLSSLMRSQHEEKLLENNFCTFSLCCAFSSAEWRARADLLLSYASQLAARVLWKTNRRRMSFEKSIDFRVNEFPWTFSKLFLLRMLQFYLREEVVPEQLLLVPFWCKSPINRQWMDLLRSSVA